MAFAGGDKPRPYTEYLGIAQSSISPDFWDIRLASKLAYQSFQIPAQDIHILCHTHLIQLFEEFCIKLVPVYTLS